MISRVIYIAGMARSGTSWLGEILDSSPEVAYCFQPLFAYAFQGRLHYDSTAEELQQFFEDLQRSDDAFVQQADKRESGLFPTFRKEKNPRYLAFKECRYQYLIPTMLERAENLSLVGIIRHPCGAINSWLRNPKEFPPGSDPLREWRFGACKNGGREENFFGYFKWKEVANLYLDLQQKYPKRATVVCYEHLVRDPLTETQRLFDFLGLELGDQTRDFLQRCHETHMDSPYAVFKDKSVADQWRHQLDRSIQEAILADLSGTRLARFVED